MKILITGDLFSGGDAVIHHLKVNSDSWHDSDLRIVNLENPLSNSGQEANKCTLHAPPTTIEFLMKIKVDVVSLANNHIQDKGESGIYETIKLLKDRKIDYVGVGRNIIDAKKPYWITDDICLMAFCDYDKPYMREIALADRQKMGVAPLRRDTILKELENLPDDKKAVLYFHWGREHVWLPPIEDIELARELLNHEKTALIVGSHAHRVQGKLQNGKKIAYMCIGNFLFPNFFIAPPRKTIYIKNDEDIHNIKVIRNYHSVDKLTYKKWKIVNRISLGIEYDTESDDIRHIPFYQYDKLPVVQEVRGLYLWLINLMIDFLSLIYKSPIKTYDLMSKANAFFSYIKFWRIKLMYLTAKEKGLKYLVKRLITHFKNI